MFGDPVDSHLRTIDPHRLAVALDSLNLSEFNPIVLDQAQSLSDDFVTQERERTATGGEFSVVVVDHVQSEGIPAHAGVHVAVHVAGHMDTSESPNGERGWLPLACSLAVSDAIRETARVPVDIEWPSTLSIPGGMCGGSAGSKHVGTVTCSTEHHLHVIGISINALTGVLNLTPDTTSLLAAGGNVDREYLIAHIVLELRSRLAQWRRADPALHAEYRARCRTVGRLVEGGWVSGIDERGQLSVTPT